MTEWSTLWNRQTVHLAGHLAGARAEQPACSTHGAPDVPDWVQQTENPRRVTCRTCRQYARAAVTSGIAKMTSAMG